MTRTSKINCSTKDFSSLRTQTQSDSHILVTLNHPGALQRLREIVPELSVDAVERQGRTESFEPVGVERQAVDALKQRLHVSGALLLLLGGRLFDRPLDELFDAAATEVSESAVHRVDHTVLKRRNKPETN